MQDGCPHLQSSQPSRTLTALTLHDIQPAVQYLTSCFLALYHSKSKFGAVCTCACVCVLLIGGCSSSCCRGTGTERNGNKDGTGNWTYSRGRETLREKGRALTHWFTFQMLTTSGAAPKLGARNPIQECHEWGWQGSAASSPTRPWICLTKMLGSAVTGKVLSSILNARSNSYSCTKKFPFVCFCQFNFLWHFKLSECRT